MISLLSVASPFFLHLDKSGLILEVGPLMRKAAKEDLRGQYFNHFFHLSTQHDNIVDLLENHDKIKLFFFEHQHQHQRFRSILKKEDDDSFFILANPVINSVYNLSHYHINLSDLPSHDSIYELIFLQQSTKTAIEEAITLNDRLESRNEKLNEKTVQLKELNEELKALLGEVHHRVKNNLALISGLLEMKKLSLTDNASRSGIDEIQQRIRSIALIHESMYKTDSFANINLKNYLQDLTAQIGKFYSSQKKVTIETDIEEIFFDNAQALPLALIVNEVMTNSFKHAFSEVEEGKIKLSLHRLDNLLTLEIRDNGKGLQGSDRPKNSLGMKLLGMLSKQLKAKHTVTSENGLIIQIMIPYGE